MIHNIQTCRKRIAKGTSSFYFSYKNLLEAAKEQMEFHKKLEISKSELYLRLHANGETQS